MRNGDRGVNARGAPKTRRLLGLPSIVPFDASQQANETVARITEPSGTGYWFKQTAKLSDITTNELLHHQKSSSFFLDLYLCSYNPWMALLADNGEFITESFDGRSIFV